MKPINIFLPALLLTACLPAYAQNLGAIYTDRNRLLYQGYVITKSAKPAADSWTITIRKNGRILRRFEIGATTSKDWAKLGLFNFLGGQSKQLVVEGYSGGAHCCWQYKIINLSPRFQIVYDSDNWDVGYDLTPVDLDKDGIYEFTQSVMAFDNFPISHASARFPPVVFKYNPGAGKYLPASRRFPTQVTEGIETNLQKISEWNKRPDLEKRTSIDEEEYTATCLDVFLRYLYSGQKKKAWEFFENNYKLGDKQEIMLDIQKKLQGCAIYKSLYSQGR